MFFNNPLPQTEENQWRELLDQFALENERSLAALAWGLSQEWGNTKEVLGIDLKPQPHFVCCSREALETLNQKVERKIQEVLGILDRYDLSVEVAIVAIGYGQIKLIYFKPEIPPPDCFEQLGGDIDGLIQQLEEKLRGLPL